MQADKTALQAQEEKKTSAKNETLSLVTLSALLFYFFITEHFILHFGM